MPAMDWPVVEDIMPSPSQRLALLPPHCMQQKLYISSILRKSADE